MIPTDLADTIRAATGRTPKDLRPLHGGCIAEVKLVELEGGGHCVAKLAAGSGDLALEAWMLRFLTEHTELPVPSVLHASDSLLLLDYVETGGRLDATAESHAADLLAALHGHSAEAFGFERGTLIGPLPQPNPWTGSWLDFFRDQRLLHFGRLALERGRLPARTMDRLEAFCGKLERYLPSDTRPALIHGDVWDGNVLVRDGRIAAFIDPAIHYADPEIELAFTTLFGTFGEAFFARYQEHRPLAPGFFEARREIYNLYPLLVHSALFGGGYAGSVARTLERYG